MAFILLPASNSVLLETIRSNITKDKKEPLDAKLYDFDDVNYRIFIDPDARDDIIISLEATSWADVRKEGSEDLIREQLGEYITDVTDSGVTFKINMADDAVLQNAEQIALKFSKLRSYALGGPLNEYCKALDANSSKTNPFDFQLRRDTRLWIVPKSDRIAVIYGFEFPIPADKIIAQQVVNEFVEVRRQKDLQATPVVAFSKDPPNELKGLNIPSWDTSAFLGYFTVLLLSRHVTADKIQTTVENLVGFRSYLTYHIKCAKAYFHSRMRARGKNLLQVLNRARYEDPDDKKKKKAITRADRR